MGLLRSKLVFLIPLLIASGCTSRHIPCVYTPEPTASSQHPELTRFKDCASLDKNGEISVNPSHLEQIDFDESGLAEIRLKDGVYYINPLGKMARVHLFDNGADYFVEGLARTVKDNKFGFIDKNLDVVIAPVYDFAFPFNNGLARVCLGCRQKKTAEHTELVDGKWAISIKPGR